MTSRREEFLDTLRAEWRTLARDLGDVEGLTEIRDVLLASWAQPHRSYHDLRHLSEVLHRLHALSGYAESLTAVRLAAWYHDAVYDGGADDEELSAQRAGRELTAIDLDSALVAEVARLVRLTVAHNPDVGDANGEVLCDADLAILAAPEPAYRRYAEAVRAEYSQVPDGAFRSGRVAILRALLERPSLFRTPIGRQHWEPAARANLAAEVARLAP